MRGAPEVRGSLAGLGGDGDLRRKRRDPVHVLLVLAQHLQHRLARRSWRIRHPSSIGGGGRGASIKEYLSRCA